MFILCSILSQKWSSEYKMLIFDIIVEKKKREHAKMLAIAAHKYILNNYLQILLNKKISLLDP